MIGRHERATKQIGAEGADGAEAHLGVIAFLVSSPGELWGIFSYLRRNGSHARGVFAVRPVDGQLMDCKDELNMRCLH